MFDLLSSKTKYRGEFTPTPNFHETLDLNGVVKATISEREFQQEDGSYVDRVSMCFLLEDGSQQFVGLSRNSQLAVGDEVDITKPVQVIRLQRGLGREDTFDKNGKNLTNYGEVCYKVDGIKKA